MLAARCGCCVVLRSNIFPGMMERRWKAATHFERMISSCFGPSSWNTTNRTHQYLLTAAMLCTSKYEWEMFVLILVCVDCRTWRREPEMQSRSLVLSLRAYRYVRNRKSILLCGEGPHGLWMVHFHVAAVSTWRGGAPPPKRSVLRYFFLIFILYWSWLNYSCGISHRLILLISGI